MPVSQKYTAKITSKGQVTLPQSIRDTLALRKGDYIILEPKGNGILVTKTSLTLLKDFRVWADRIAKRFKSRGITRAEVEKAIQWARKS